MRRVKLLHRFGVFGSDVSVAHVLANDRPVFAFYQRVVLAATRAALGELDQQILEQFVYLVVDVFRAVVGMKSQNPKWKLMQDRLQYRQQILLADPPHCVTASTALM